MRTVEEIQQLLYDIVVRHEGHCNFVPDVTEQLLQMDREHELFSRSDEEIEDLFGSYALDALLI